MTETNMFGWETTEEEMALMRQTLPVETVQCPTCGAAEGQPCAGAVGNCCRDREMARVAYWMGMKDGAIEVIVEALTEEDR